MTAFRRASRPGGIELSDMVEIPEHASRRRAEGRDVLPLPTGEPDILPAIGVEILRRHPAITIAMRERARDVIIDTSGTVPGGAVAQSLVAATCTGRAKGQISGPGRQRRPCQSLWAIGSDTNS